MYFFCEKPSFFCNLFTVVLKREDTPKLKETETLPLP